MANSNLVISLLQSGIPSNQVMKFANLDIEGISDLERVWAFANKVGAPISEALLELHEIDEGGKAASFELEQSLAMPKATKSLMLWLPVFGLLLSQAFGLNPFSGLFNPLGVAAFLLALGLLFLGDRWSEKLIRGLSSNSTTPTLHLLLISIALKAGLGIRDAKAQVAEFLKNNQGESDSAVEIAQATGAPISNVLVGLAKEIRQQNTSLAIQNAKALSVRLLIPLGATVLPAFLLLTVVPVLISQLTR